MTTAPIAVFDLDGTLADTAHDLVATLNVILGQEGVAPLPIEAARDMISAGGRGLLERGFEVARREPTPALIEELYRRFIAHYFDNLCVETRLYPGVLDALDRLEDPGNGELFPYVMVEQHEQQHVETMLATHQLRDGGPVLGAGAPLPTGRDVAHDAVLVPGGPFLLGVDAGDEPWSLDNERPAHVVDLPAFRIARFPVTNAEWQQFVDDAGYDTPQWWSPRGWEHRLAAGLQRPEFWTAGGARRRFGIIEEIPPEEPVQHVCYFEAEAYAAWAGARLPTEQEWEKA
ncbi:MAG TPA: SUMF1/EgtB/PvdO family nonheme iron enzyme, partial [Beijerinckiaceae bacterium]|nr:SUMF1/EgtB/PvdO family nonheme iron enzyme [Beijerinckiaceae bacterium]